MNIEKTIFTKLLANLNIKFRSTLYKLGSAIGPTISDKVPKRNRNDCVTLFRRRPRVKQTGRGNNKKEKGREESHARARPTKNRKIQFVEINRLVHKLTNSDELADKGLH